jgi:DNA polymerase-3 subunit alpha
MTRIPKRFVSLHNHSTFSAMDAIGYPDDIFKYCIENGLDAHAITDHGNMNGYAHAQLWAEDYNKKNDVKFKYIPGVEGYFHPDLTMWEKDKELHEQAKTDKKLDKKLKDKLEVQTQLIVHTDESEDVQDIEMSNQLTIEDEDATKSNKHFNPINRRHHLVVLPKNSEGLKEIFSLVSKSYLKNFYRFPRFDAKDLQKIAKNGNIITSSACIGGHIAWSIFQLLQGVDFDKLDQKMLDDDALMKRCLIEVGNYFELLENSTGEGNNYLELQFNKLPAQNLVNRAILEFAKQNGLNDKLVVTCDAHYYNPEVWKERELYKKLGFLNYKEINSDSLPKSRDELKCELYPKNAVQLWETYNAIKCGTSFYDDDVIP